jgi:hypothetical protein
MSGQPALGSNQFFSLDVSNLQVLDLDGTPGDFILSRAKGCKLQVTLKFEGSLRPIILCCLCWEICYCFDVFCFDSSQPGASRPQDISFCSPRYCAHTDTFEYTGAATEVTVPPNSLAVATYKLAAVARFYWKCTCTPPIIRPPVLAGFTEGPVVEVTA